LKHLLQQLKIAMFGQNATIASWHSAAVNSVIEPVKLHHIEAITIFS
jgi:hypothetical protein